MNLLGVTFQYLPSALRLPLAILYCSFVICFFEYIGGVLAQSCYLLVLGEIFERSHKAQSFITRQE
jgi:hypothetical protein